MKWRRLPSTPQRPPRRVAVVVLLGGEGCLVLFLPVDQVAKSGGRAGDGRLVGALLVVLHLGAAGFVANGAQAQAYLLLFHVDLDDLEVVLQTGFQLGRAPPSPSPALFVCHSRSRGPRRAHLLVGVGRESAFGFCLGKYPLGTSIKPPVSNCEQTRRQSRR